MRWSGDTEKSTRHKSTPHWVWRSRYQEPEVNPVSLRAGTPAPLLALRYAVVIVVLVMLGFGLAPMPWARAKFGIAGCVVGLIAAEQFKRRGMGMLARPSNHGPDFEMVGTGRFELPTPRTPSECSTRLSHVPTEG